MSCHSTFGFQILQEYIYTVLEILILVVIVAGALVVATRHPVLPKQCARKLPPRPINTAGSSGDRATTRIDHRPEAESVRLLFNLCSKGNHSIKLFTDRCDLSFSES